MIVTLILCLTESNHNFENLLTFVGLIDNVLLYDTGLTKKEVDLLYSYFKDVKITHIIKKFKDYSHMRNDAIKYARKVYKPRWVIMPDDSWSVSGLNKKVLINCLGYNSIITDFKVNNRMFNLERIFKPDQAKFYGKVNEELVVFGSKIYCDGIVFVENHEDPIRSLNTRSKLVDWKDGRQAFFQSELYRRVINDEIKKRQLLK